MADSTFALSVQLQALAARVAALEAQGIDEALQPTLITINPITGLVGADFTGTIHAEGITFPAVTTPPPTPAQSIEWVTSGNAAVAQIWGERSGSVSATYRDALALGASDQAINRMRVLDSGGGIQGLLDVDFNGATGLVEVLALAGANQVTVMDSRSNSNFLRLQGAVPQNLQMQSGSLTIAASATIADYAITLPSAWPNNHLVFIAAANPNSSLAVGDCTVGSTPSGVAQGLVAINSTVAQNWSVFWISLGN